jgi:hypothetical protein
MKMNAMNAMNAKWSFFFGLKEIHDNLRIESSHKEVYA